MSASFARAAVRPFAAPSAFSSSFFSGQSQAVVRHISTSGRAASKSKAIPAFNTQSFFASLRRSNTQSRFSNFYFSAGRRFQSGSAEAAADATTAAQVSWFKRMWDSPIGLKTVHFWAPVMKWALVVAGISDLARPAEKLSVTQNVALTATGLIWTRWCLIIKPKNYLLAAANFFLGIAGMVQCVRIYAARTAIAAEAEAKQ